MNFESIGLSIGRFIRPFITEYGHMMDLRVSASTIHVIQYSICFIIAILVIAGVLFDLDKHGYSGTYVSEHFGNKIDHETSILGHKLKHCWTSFKKPKKGKRS